MKKIVFQISIMILLLTSCNTNKNISFAQIDCGECFVNLSFFHKKINRGSLILKRKITVTNPYLQQMKFKVNYYKEEEIVFSAYAYSNWFDKNEESYMLFSEGIIKLNPLEKIEFYFDLWNHIDTDVIRYKELSSYINLSQLSKYEDILSYQEPFSEFKRKNPELLEFLTKGDSIELEVISPVKQKYKFKAEW